MVLHYKGFNIICEQLICGLWVGEIIGFPYENRYVTDRNIDNLEWKFHSMVDDIFKQEAEEEITDESEILPEQL